MTTLEQIKEKIAKFEELQDKHGDFGASDTEPDGVFQVQLARAVMCVDVHIPTNAEEWELFDDMDGVEIAAQELHDATQECVDLIGEVKNKEMKEVRKYLQGYCWRCSW